MNVLVYLVPMALALGVTGLVAFLWSIRARQYDDLEGAALRVLCDDDVEPPPQNERLRQATGLSASSAEATHVNL